MIFELKKTFSESLNIMAKISYCCTRAKSKCNLE